MKYEIVFTNRGWTIREVGTGKVLRWGFGSASAANEFLQKGVPASQS